MDSFFLRGETLEHQKSVRRDAERGVMMKATPVTPLIVTQAELGLQLLIIPLDPPARLGMAHQFLEGELLRQGGQPIMSGLGLCLRPFDQQPLLGARLVAMSRMLRRTTVFDGAVFTIGDGLAA